MRDYYVSTHSRPKAAAAFYLYAQNKPNSFNTQPPEGGCDEVFVFGSNLAGFNTQPPEGGCLSYPKSMVKLIYRFNTQPPEGGCSLPKKARKISVLNTVFR